MKKQNLPFTIIITFLFAAHALKAEAPAQEKSLTEIFRTGKVRFVPEVTITDESMAGKAYFSQIADIALDDQGNIYACDPIGNIKKFDASGSFLGTIGRPGQGPGEFNNPIEVEWSKGRLYVRERISIRVSILEDNGHFIKWVSFDMSEGRLWRMQALPDGRIIIQKEKINRGNLDAPQEMFIDLYSRDLEFIKTIYQHEVRRIKYITSPRLTSIPIPFAASVRWGISPAGKVIIGYSGKYEFEIHDPDKGKLSSFSHTYAPVELTAKDKARHFQGIVATVTGTDGSVTQQKCVPTSITGNTEFPRYKPAFYDINVDAEGNIWVMPYALAADRAEPKMDVFDSTGRFLSAVRIVDGAFPYTMTPLRRGFWAARVNTDGEWTIVKYRILA